MPLIHCPACRHPVPGTAKQCPICGCPLSHHGSADTITIRLNITKICLVILIVIVIAIGAFALYQNSPKQHCIDITRQMIADEARNGYGNRIPSSVNAAKFHFDIFFTEGFYEVEGTDGEWCASIIFYDTMEPGVLFLQRAKEYE